MQVRQQEYVRKDIKEYFVLNVKKDTEFLQNLLAQFVILQVI